MAKKEEIQQLLNDLRTADEETEQRRIRRELRKRGYFLSRQGRGFLGVVIARREAGAQVVTTLRLPADLHRRLQLLAADEGTSANAILEQVLRKHLDAHGVPSRLNRER